MPYTFSSTLMTYAAAVVSAAAGADPTTVSLQGNLSNGGVAVEGPVSLRLALFDDADPLVGSKVDLDGDGTTQGPDEDVIVRSVNVVGGVFETDFGPLAPTAFDGTPRFLQIEVDGVSLSRVPFRATPGVAATLASPDGSQQVVLTSSAGEVSLGDEDPAARIDIGPLSEGAVLGAGLINSVADNGSERSTISGTPGFSDNVQAGDILVANSNGNRLLLGMVSAILSNGQIITGYQQPLTVAPGSPFEIRRPVLRVAANPDSALYPDGQQTRSGLMVADDGRVGVNTFTPEVDLDVAGVIGAAAVLLQDIAMQDGEISSTTVTAGEVIADRIDGSFVQTYPIAVNEAFGAFQIGNILVQFGRFDSGSNGIAFVTLPIAYPDVNSVALAHSTFTPFNSVHMRVDSGGSRLDIRTTQNDGTGLPFSSPTTGTWIAIGVVDEP